MNMAISTIMSVSYTHLSMRVPTLDVSVVDLTVNLKKAASKAVSYTHLAGGKSL